MNASDGCLGRVFVLQIGHHAAESVIIELRRPPGHLDILSYHTFGTRWKVHDCDMILM